MAARRLPNQPHDLTGLSVSALRFFGEHPTTVHIDLEHAARRLGHLDLGVRKGAPNLGRQTGGPGLVVSDDAVFDGHEHSD
jgi:hypothetical protein